MGEEKKDKKDTPLFKNYYNGMTPEEVLESRRANVRKAVETKKKKWAAIQEARKQAVDLVPRLLAEEMLLLDNDNYTPRPETLEKVRKLLDAPTMTLEKLRRDYFRSMSEKGWEKLTRFLFKDHVSGEADLGLQILEQRNDEIVRMERRIRMITKEIKIAKKAAKAKGLPARAPTGLLDLLIQVERDLRDYKADVNKNIYKVNLESNKAKGSTSVHIHTTIPRPEAKDVTPKKQNLTELLNGD